MDVPIICSSCGLESATGFGYTRRMTRTLCPTCQATRRGNKDRRAAIFFWSLLAITALAWRLGSPAGVRALLLTWSALYVVGFGMIVIHELGHALAALGLGIRVRGMEIGRGPALFSVGGESFSFAVRAAPAGGLTMLAAATRAVRTRHIIVTVAGPFVEAMAVVAAFLWQPAGAWGEWLRGIVLIVGVISLVVNIVIPVRGNDAWSMWQLLTVADEEVGALAGTAAHDATVRAVNEAVDRGNVGSDTFRTALGAFRERADLPGEDRGRRAVALTNVASMCLMLEDPNLLPEADAASEESLGIAPYVPEIALNRGAVLVALGRDTEAQPLLEQALGALTGRDTEGAHAPLALIAARAGDIFNARRHLGHVRVRTALPAYREAVRLAGPLELRVILSAYWADTLQAAEIAEEFRGDAGPAVAASAGVLLTFCEWGTDGDFGAVCAEAGVSLPPAAARSLAGAIGASLLPRAA